jgi:hypothetical protein
MEGSVPPECSRQPGAGAGPAIPHLPVITVFFGWQGMPAVLILRGNAIIPVSGQFE